MNIIVMWMLVASLSSSVTSNDDYTERLNPAEKFINLCPGSQKLN